MKKDSDAQPTADTQTIAKESSSPLPPWSGNLDESELYRPGGLLLAALIRCATERRQQLSDMSKELGVTYGYINQLRKGIRQTTQISDDFALACAKYLIVPRLTVLMLAGRITPDDWFESKSVMITELSRAMAYIGDDPEWGPRVTPEVRQGSLETQFLVVKLYEQATHKKLLPSSIDEKSIPLEIKKLQALQELRQEKIDAYIAKKS